MTDAIRSVQKEQKGLPVGVARMMGLETAADMLGGKGPLADAIGIDPRALRYKLTGDRGVSSGDLMLAAAALDRRAARIVAHAAKLRNESGVAPAIDMEVL